MNNPLRARTGQLIPQLVQFSGEIKIWASHALEWLSKTIVTVESSEDIGLMELHRAVKWHLAWEKLKNKEKAQMLSPVANRLFAADQRIVRASVKFINYFNK